MAEIPTDRRKAEVNMRTEPDRGPMGTVAQPLLALRRGLEPERQCLPAVPTVVLASSIWVHLPFEKWKS